MDCPPHHPNSSVTLNAMEHPKVRWALSGLCNSHENALERMWCAFL